MRVPRAAGAAPALAAALILTPVAVQAAPSQPSDPGAPVAGAPSLELPDDVAVIGGPAAQPSTATTADEVVITVGDPQSGTLEVLTVETASRAAASALSQQLDARPDVTAEVNQAVAAAPEQVRPAGQATGRAGAAAAAVPTLAQETRGSELWGMSALDVETAWQRTRGQSVTVAVVDSGVDPHQPELAGHLLGQIDLVGDNAAGDPYGHGTHVAGTIAAAADGRGVVGVAPEAKILPVRVLGADGTGSLGWVAEGVVRAVDAGAQVINLSLTSTGRSEATRKAVEYAVSRGVTVVAAAGNEYQKGNPTEYPAALPGVLGVAAVSHGSAGELQPSAFSNSGNYVDIAAPGSGILSSLSRSSLASAGSADEYQAAYGYGEGTSMASPHVAGVAALVRAANPALGKTQVDQVILATALDIGPAAGWDARTGYGLVRADRAVQRATSIVDAPATARAYPVNRGGDLRVDVDPDGAGTWRFRVQRRTSTGNWVNRGPARRATGAASARTVGLPAGTYRVVVAAKAGYSGTTTAPVTLTK